MKLNQIISLPIKSKSSKNVAIRDELETIYTSWLTASKRLSSKIPSLVIIDQLMNEEVQDAIYFSTNSGGDKYVLYYHYGGEHETIYFKTRHGLILPIFQLCSAIYLNDPSVLGYSFDFYIDPNFYHEMDSEKLDSLLYPLVEQDLKDLLGLVYPNHAYFVSKYKALTDLTLFVPFESPHVTKLRNSNLLDQMEELHVDYNVNTINSEAFQEMVQGLVKDCRKLMVSEKDVNIKRIHTQNINRIREIDQSLHNSFKTPPVKTNKQIHPDDIEKAKFLNIFGS